MRTILIELRYHSEPGTHEQYSGLVDGINDVVLGLAQRFSLEILSMSHVVEDENATSITCTAVCLLNEHTAEQIGKTLEAENQKNNLYCFLERGRKLSVRVDKINYN